MKQLVENLVEQLVKDRTPKVKKSVVSEILGRLFYDNIDKELFGLFVQDVKNNSIYKSLDFLDGTKMSVNIFDYLINESYIPIMKTLFGCKPNIEATTWGAALRYAAVFETTWRYASLQTVQSECVGCASTPLA